MSKVGCLRTSWVMYPCFFFIHGGYSVKNWARTLVHNWVSSAQGLPQEIRNFSFFLPCQLMSPCGVGAKWHTSSSPRLCLAVARRSIGLVCSLVRCYFFLYHLGPFPKFVIKPLAKHLFNRYLSFEVYQRLILHKKRNSLSTFNQNSIIIIGMCRCPSLKIWWPSFIQ